VIAFERVEAAEPAMLEAVKEALVYLDAPPGSGFGRPRALRDYWSPAPHSSGVDEQMFGEE
jgi:hypothetical protein